MRDGEVTVRAIMELTITCDHRILYGADAAQFLGRIRERLENPLSLALDLLHKDVCTYARFRRPGHRATGDRSQRDRHWMAASTRVGYDYAHAIVDDHSRLAYVELHQDEKAATVTGLSSAPGLRRRARHHRARLMADDAFTYVKHRSLRELLAAHGIRRLTTQPYRPRTNGKIERFHQTMGREWGHGRSYPSSAHRASLLGDWLSTTTTGDRTQRSATGRPSAAFPLVRLHRVVARDARGAAVGVDDQAQPAARVAARDAGAVDVGRELARVEARTARRPAGRLVAT